MVNDSLSRIHCNRCGHPTKHELIHKEEKHWDEDVNDEFAVHGADIYELLECRGCENIVLRHRDWFSEDINNDGSPVINTRYYPPATYRPFPRWLWKLDEEWYISKLLKEIYSAIQNSAPSLALMGVRALIEAIMIETVGDKGSFGANLSAFEHNGHVSKIQREFLEHALEAGHASIHRGFLPDNRHLSTCVDIAENLMETLFVLPDAAKHLRKVIPQRKK
jgi:hypothetical protein